MNTLAEAYCQNYNQTNTGNFQSIKEAFLRLAVKYCENYATDVLVLFEHIDNLNKENISDMDGYSEDYNIEIGFRQFGIDWPLVRTTKYRFFVVLEKKGEHFTLTGKVGDV